MNTGIRRKVDDLGRVVIPAGIRRSLQMREGDAVEVHVEGDRVVLTKPADHCVFCRSEEDLQTFREKAVCRTCVAGLGVLDDRVRPRPAAEPRADRGASGLAPWPSDRARGSDGPGTAPGPGAGDARERAGAGAPGRDRRDEPRQDPPASTTAW